MNTPDHPNNRIRAHRRSTPAISLLGTRPAVPGRRRHIGARMMRPTLLRLTRLMITAGCWLLAFELHAANAVSVTRVDVDPATLCCIGLAVPISGDDNFNATASIDFRVSGAGVWVPGLELLRVRPDTLGRESPPSDYGLPSPASMFAGSIFGLTADTVYEVRVRIADPDGGGMEQTIVTRTRKDAPMEPANPRQVNVATQAALAAALAGARPGDVINIAAGNYTGPLTLNASGTVDNPIFLRGSDATLVTVNAPGASYGLTIAGSHIVAETFTVTGSDWGARISATDNVVVRRMRFMDVNKGIDARFGSHRNFIICDNELRGRLSWPNVSNTTWDQEGIVITGEGHVVCHNTLSGFGDALGLSQNTAIINRAIDFYGNDVQWSGDDGLEIDYGHRNIRVFGNRVANSGMGVSVQPSWGGPIYILRNVLVNQAHSPFKFNNDPTGIIVLNNTALRSSGPGNYGGWAWPQLGYTQADGAWAYVANLRFHNNLLIGGSGPARITSALLVAQIDYNGWFPDGPFTLFNTYNDLADLQQRSPYEAHGIVLNGATFANPPVLGSDYTTRIDQPDVALINSSNAIDAAQVFANVSDAYRGNGPDLGALELGDARPRYGVRPLSLPIVAPAPPTDVELR